MANHFNYGAWRALILSLLLIWCVRPQNWHIHAGLKKVLVRVVTLVLVVAGVVTVLAFNFLLIEYTQYLTTLPLCNTYFHRVFEVQNNLTAGGLFGTNSVPFGPECFHEFGYFSLSTMIMTWRNFLIFIVGIFGSAHDIVWDLVFRIFAEQILKSANIKKQVDYEFYRVMSIFRSCGLRLCLTFCSQLQWYHLDRI